MLRHANAFAICIATIDANTSVDRIASGTPASGSDAPACHPRNSAAPIGSSASDSDGLDRTEEPERPSQDAGDRAAGVPRAAGGSIHRARLRALAAERERGQQVGADVEREDLQHRQHERDARRR